MSEPTDYHRLVRRWPGHTKRTYRLREDVADQINAVAQQHRVGVSDLACYLLAYALGQVKAGKLIISTREAPLRTIDWDR